MCPFSEIVKSGKSLHPTAYVNHAIKPLNNKHIPKSLPEVG